MGRWASHLEQPGAEKRWQLGSTKYLGLGQKSITASLTAFRPKGRPWRGRRCKGHSPLRGEAPGLGGQHRRASRPRHLQRWTWSWSVAAARPGPGIPLALQVLQNTTSAPRGVLPICERGASKTCASQPVSPQALWDSTPTGASPLPPWSRPCGSGSCSHSFISQEDTNDQSTLCTCSAGTPAHTTWLYLRFHPSDFPVLGVKFGVWGRRA